MSKMAVFPFVHSAEALFNQTQFEAVIEVAGKLLLRPKTKKAP